MKPNKYIQSTACAIGTVLVIAGGKPSSATSPYSADRRGSSGPHTRTDDQGIRAAGGPHGLRLGVASRLCLQPADGAHEGSRNGSPRRHHANRSDESGRDADQLHRSSARPSSPSRTRMSCTGWAGCLSQRNRWSFKCPTLVNVSGRSRCTTRARTRLASLGCNTAPSPVSTWSWGRTGKAKPPPALPAWCARPPSSRVAMPRIFMDDTPEDHAAIQPALSQIQVLPAEPVRRENEDQRLEQAPTFPGAKRKGPARVFDQATALG